MSIYELILSRRTIRRFKQKRIHFELLTKIVNAGRIAPSASNLQPCEFMVIDDSELIKQIYETTKWAGYLPAETGPPPPAKRPTAFIVVLLNRERCERGGEHDAAAAIMNMIYTAQEEGIGSCWIGSVDRKKVKVLTGLADFYDIDSVLALGYTDENPRMEEIESTVTYWRDEQGILHVPKRPLHNILHHNTYKAD